MADLPGPTGVELLYGEAWVPVAVTYQGQDPDDPSIAVWEVVLPDGWPDEEPPDAIRAALFPAATALVFPMLSFPRPEDVQAFQDRIAGAVPDARPYGGRDAGRDEG